MKDMMPFVILVCLLIFQRISELFLAARNERWMKQQGGVEFGGKHYRLMVAMHSMFLVCFIAEKVIFNKESSPVFLPLLFLFLLAQILRIWAIRSLGRYWNTKIMVVPGASVIRKGPYRYIKHPNYLVVSIEIGIIPLLFSAYITFALFTLLNVFILSVRISNEEKALSRLTEYETVFQSSHRFVPKLIK